MRRSGPSGKRLREHGIDGGFEQTLASMNSLRQIHGHYVRNGGAFLLLWWLVIFVQSITGLGIVSSALFFATTFIIALKYKHLRAPMLCGAYYLPLAALDVPSPFVVLTAMVALPLLTEKFDPKKLVHPLLMSYGLFLALAVVSVLYTSHTNPWQKLVTYLQSGMLLLILSLLVTSSADVRRIMGWIALFSALSVIVSITHYNIGQEHTYLGAKVYRVLGEEALVGKATVSSMDLTRRYIWAGIDPNFYGMVLLTGFMAALSLWESGVLRTRAPYFFCLALIAIGILGSYSRSTLVVAVIGAVLYYLSLGKIPLTVVAIGAVLLGAFLAYNPEVVDRIGSIQENVVEKGGTGRMDHIKEGLEYWARAPFGHGIGSVQVGLKPEEGSDVGTTHSTYIEILAELGPLGLGLFCYMIYCAWWQSRGNHRHASGLHAIFLKGLTATLLSLVAFVATIPLSQFTIFFVVLVLACQTYVQPRWLRQERRKPLPLSRTPRLDGILHHP